MRRAYTWLERSERTETEDIERFVFLWIAFNAAYGDESALREFVEGGGARETEPDRFRTFLRNIVQQDEAGVLERIVWDEFPGPIRILLSNRYVYRPFWLAVWGSDRGADWRRRFDASTRIAMAALSNRNVSTVLSVVFDRLYTLRNQIFHGGTTYPSGFGQDQNSGRKRHHGVSCASHSRHHATRHRCQPGLESLGQGCIPAHRSRAEIVQWRGS